jgi:zinc/manganese transport system ATP-binding protein
MNKNGVIQLKNVSGGYRDHAVWHGANLTVGKGEFVGVLGPNGAGKTTLFHLLLGLTPPLAGSVEIFGDSPRRGNSRIGYVPQRHRIDSETRIRALELVRLGLNGTRWGFATNAADTGAAMEALRSVGAEELANRPLGALSGGELQRVFLAEALVGKPDVLLLDEPLSNLDIRRETELVRLVSQVVRDRAVTALLIAHNINPLLPVMDTVMYVAGGRIATGKPHEVLTSESLTKLYGIPVEVLHDSRGRIAIIGTEETATQHHHHHQH